MNALLRMAIFLLVLSPLTRAQQAAPTPPTTIEALKPYQHALAKLKWQQHLDDNKQKLKNGDTGRLVITVKPRLGHILPPNIRIRVSEHVPQHARPGPGIHITHHFVQTGNVVDGKITVNDIPIGLTLEVEVWPIDQSAPPARYKVAGPGKRGQMASLATSPAQPFPVLTGRVLDANGEPVCNQAVAIELRTQTLPFQMQGRTDAAGRFRIPVRVSPHFPPHGVNKSPGATITAVRGELIRKGNYRFWTTEMPVGARATAEVFWPWAVLTDIGDLQIAPRK